MKKLFIILAAVAMVFVSCKKENKDNPVNPTPSIAEQVVGKWLYIESDGEMVETSESSITNFVMEGSTLKAYTSISMKDHDLWAYNYPTDVLVEGNKLTLTMEKGDIKTIEEFTDITVSGDDLRYTCNYTILRNGEVVDEMGPYQLHCVKVNVDYTEAIVGIWEAQVPNGDQQQTWRWDFDTDGTYVFSMKNGDNPWHVYEDEMSEYFVDGPLFCTHWQHDALSDVERDWWQIESIQDGKMKWTAVRVGDDLSTYTETLELIHEDTPGVLSGEFSVSASQKVHFSQGNLQFVGTWQFAEHQWDCFGSSQYDNHRDLFGWGTGDAPNNVSTDNNDYGTFVDWGTDAWRTLTKDEWVYLFYTRTNAATLFGLGSVNGVNGTILLPDNWTLPAGASFTASTTQGLEDAGGYYSNPNSDNFSHNTYTTAEWAVMEANGAVFLPAAGSRNGTDVDYVGLRGGYRSATSDDTENAYYLSFGSGLLYPQYNYFRYFGFSVRLVR